MMPIEGRILRRGDDRKYEDRYAQHARAVLRAFIDGMPGGQKEAARVMGVHQGTLSRSLSTQKQPSLRVLIALSKLTGRRLDSILGLDLDLDLSQPLPSPAAHGHR